MIGGSLGTGKTPLVVVTTLAMTAFAANSVLARLALADDDIDPGTYTSIRLATGTLMLLPLIFLSRGIGPADAVKSGSWVSAAALFVYAGGFSYAYVTLGAGTGALILFGVVQAVILGTALIRGERPGWGTYLGLTTALAGLVYLVAPGVSAPDPVGSVLMVLAGVGWAVYTLRGRGGPDPLAATGANFLLSLPFCVALFVLVITFDDGRVSAHGILLATASGALASGLGYTLWYLALPLLTRAQAGVIQLSPVPLAAAGGLLLLGEPLTARLAAATVLILGGVALAVVTPDRRTT
jgi:drug/metabolite transporter (DMT)-like permease